MKRLFSVALVLLFAIVLPAQEKIDYSAIAQLKSLGLSQSQVMEISEYLTDVNGPRLTNSPGYFSAAEYAMKKMKEWGMENVALESIGEYGTGWSVEFFNVWVSEPFFIDVIAYPKAWVGGIEGTLSGTPILVEINTEEDFKKYEGKLEGAIVMTEGPKAIDEKIMEQEGRRYDEEDLEEIAAIEPRIRRNTGDRASRWAQYRFRRKVSDFLQNQGVGAIIEPSMWDEHNIRLGNGGSYEKGAKPGTPAFVLSAEHYNRLARMMQAGKEITINLELRTKYYDEDTNAYNVVGEIPGSDPDLKDEVVIIGGHFDSWHAGTGAVDNASGCAVALEAVRLIKAAGLKPRRTIRVCLWTGEEQGLHGSRKYVNKHYGDPATMELLPEHEKFSAYFNMDNGTGAFRGIYAQSNAEVVPIFEAWGKTVKDLGFSTVTFRNTGGTDHLAFEAVGLPGFQFIQDPITYMNRNHHSSMDVYDQLIPEDMIKNSVIMAVFAYNTAMRDEKLPRKPLPEPRGERQRR
jgi:carboxypeptidase Q